MANTKPCWWLKWSKEQLKVKEDASRFPSGLLYFVLDQKNLVWESNVVDMSLISSWNWWWISSDKFREKILISWMPQNPLYWFRGIPFFSFPYWVWEKGMMFIFLGNRYSYKNVFGIISVQFCMIKVDSIKYNIIVELFWGIDLSFEVIGHLVKGFGHFPNSWMLGRRIP